MQIVDVRDTAKYEEERITGAIGIQLADLPARINDLKQGFRIFCYGDAGSSLCSLRSLCRRALWSCVLSSH
jgi:rhodanese-related sulfurtransferase